MLALCVYREARGETPRGQTLVAQVILNRTRDPLKRWPRTITGVVTQSRQFSSFNIDDINSRLFPKEGSEVWLQCLTSAQRALNAKTPLTVANHYHTTLVKPKWSDPRKITETEGHHVFLYL